MVRGIAVPNHSRNIQGRFPAMTVFICQYCSSERPNTNSFKNHERRCKLNPNRKEQIVPKIDRNNYETLNNDFALCSYGCGNIAKYKTKSGKYLCSKATSSCSAIKEKIKSNQKNLKPNPIDPEKFQEKKRKISESIKLRYASGWEPTCGRCKKYDYESPIAGKIKVDGTWELKVAKHLDELNVHWIRNKKRFDYIKPDGSKSTYQPDFYVKDWDIYLEIKGYETELDRAKWKQFPEKLQVWYKDKIDKLEG